AVVFVLASVACGLAPGLPALLAARAVQGVAAAVMLPASLALVREAYGDPGRRARAVSLWAAGGTVAVALGPVAGGALTTAWSWRGIFFVNLPLGLLALALLGRVARSERGPAPLDLPGQLTAMAALGRACTWRMTATVYGTERSVHRTGALTVDTGGTPHDFLDTGSPDILVPGQRHPVDARQPRSAPVRKYAHVEPAPARNTGPGWDACDRIVVAGNVGGDRFSDLVARDTVGVLWLYLGNGDGTFAARTRTGGGCGTRSRAPRSRRWAWRGVAGRPRHRGEDLASVGKRCTNRSRSGAA
ncbi:MFS transporter, partial [Streptomyces massasporeus]